MMAEMNRQELEQELLALVSRILMQYKEALAAVGLRTGEVDLKRWDDSGAPRSEITISLLAGTRFFDVIEFFAWDDGRAIAAETMEVGIMEELDDAIERRHRGNH